MRSLKFTRFPVSKGIHARPTGGAWPYRQTKKLIPIDRHHELRKQELGEGSSSMHELLGTLGEPAFPYVAIPLPAHVEPSAACGLAGD